MLLRALRTASSIDDRNLKVNTTGLIMKMHGLHLADKSVAENLTIAGGAEFPPAEMAGELFYKLGSGPGLCIFDGVGWVPLGTTFVPGEIKLMAHGTIPAGWLVCDGRKVFTNEWPQLFAAIEYMYGNFQEQFALPDLRNRVPMQVGSALAAGAVEIGASGGTDEQEVGFTLTVEQLPAHDHSVSGKLKVSTDEGDSASPYLAGFLASGNSDGSSAPLMYRRDSSSNVVQDAGTIEITEESTGGGAEVKVNIPQRLPAYVGLNYIIYAGAQVV